jgi:hypothetical protein
MTDTPSSSRHSGEPSREEMISAMFANLVIQQTNMAMMFMGRMPHPETGERVRDLDTARFFIDQLEMIEVKTKGNLDKQEQQLLTQSLTALRMAFVEAVNEPAPAPAKASDTAPPAAPSAPDQGSSTSPSSSTVASPTEEESHKKFTKKY